MPGDLSNVAAFADSADMCARVDCESYDISPEATRCFLQAQAKEHTLEGGFPTIH
jgi:hypothetical protein